jgi:hypothetical protein
MTVLELRAALESRGLDSKGKRSRLVARLQVRKRAEESDEEVEEDEEPGPCPIDKCYGSGFIIIRTGVFQVCPCSFSEEELEGDEIRCGMLVRWRHPDRKRILKSRGIDLSSDEEAEEDEEEVVAPPRRSSGKKVIGVESDSDDSPPKRCAKPIELESDPAEAPPRRSGGKRAIELHSSSSSSSSEEECATDWRQLTAGDLRKACERRGLSKQGVKATLAKRLRECVPRDANLNNRARSNPPSFTRRYERDVEEEEEDEAENDENSYEDHGGGHGSGKRRRRGSLSDAEEGLGFIESDSEVGSYETNDEEDSDEDVREDPFASMYSAHRAMAFAVRRGLESEEEEEEEEEEEGGVEVVATRTVDDRFADAEEKGEIIDVERS